MSFSFGYPAFPPLSISGCLAYRREPAICGGSKSLEETSNILIRPIPENCLWQCGHSSSQNDPNPLISSSCPLCRYRLRVERIDWQGRPLKGLRAAHSIPPRAEPRALLLPQHSSSGRSQAQARASTALQGDLGMWSDLLE